jgi:hypothetical protein
MFRRLYWIVVLAFLVIPAPPGGVVPAFARARAGVPPLVAGVHAPNREWTEVDYERVARGRFGTVKMMSYHPPEAFARLRRDNPALQFALRLDTPWNELPDPLAFAALQVPYLRSLIGAGYELWVEIGNEPNLELHPESELAFASWYEVVLGALRAAVPEARYGFPGLAENRREMAWLEASAPAIEASDWLGVHAYWATEGQMLDPRHALKFMEFHRRFPHLPVLVTEAGNNALGVPEAERARQYARFVRTVARLPYVRALHFFILSGTVEWQRFFFDDTMVVAVREAGREPVPLLDGLQESGRYVVAAVQPLLGRSGGPGAEPRPSPPSRPVLPTPAPTGRRQLLVDPQPRAPDGAGTGGRWQRQTPGGGLRTTSAYLATHLSLRAEVAPPLPGVPLAMQLAEADLSAADPGAEAIGFALLWDGREWRLQYWREGEAAVDMPLSGVPASGAGGTEWYHLEVAIEPRSAAVWLWPRGASRPPEPNAVFAPPEAAAKDGARPRYVILPDHPVANVHLEGETRDS